MSVVMPIVGSCLHAQVFMLVQAQVFTLIQANCAYRYPRQVHSHTRAHLTQAPTGAPQRRGTWWHLREECDDGKHSTYDVMHGNLNVTHEILNVRFCCPLARACNQHSGNASGLEALGQVDTGPLHCCHSRQRLMHLQPPGALAAANKAASSSARRIGRVACLGQALRAVAHLL